MGSGSREEEEVVAEERKSGDGTATEEEGPENRDIRRARVRTSFSRAKAASEMKPLVHGRNSFAIAAVGGCISIPPEDNEQAWALLKRSHTNIFDNNFFFLTKF